MPCNRHESCPASTYCDNRRICYNCTDSRGRTCQDHNDAIDESCPQNCNLAPTRAPTPPPTTRAPTPPPTPPPTTRTPTPPLSTLVPTNRITTVESAVAAGAAFDAALAKSQDEAARENTLFLAFAFPVAIMTGATGYVILARYDVDEQSTWRSKHWWVLGSLTFRVVDIMSDWAFKEISLGDKGEPNEFQMRYAGDADSLRTASLCFCIMGALVFPFEIYASFKDHQRGRESHHLRIIKGSTIAVLLLEDFPQLLMFTIYTGAVGVNGIAIFSMIFSAVSLIKGVHVLLRMENAEAKQQAESEQKSVEDVNKNPKNGAKIGRDRAAAVKAKLNRSPKNNRKKTTVKVTAYNAPGYLEVDGTAVKNSK